MANKTRLKYFQSSLHELMLREEEENQDDWEDPGDWEASSFNLLNN